MEGSCVGGTEGSGSPNIISDMSPLEPTIQQFYSADGACPSGFDYSYGDKCYAPVEQAKTWSACRTACTDLHADMLCVASQGENDYLYANNQGNVLWLGYNDFENADSTFAWDGVCASSYTNWALDEPDITSGGACAGLLPSLNGWNDFDCWEEHKCYCEWTSPVTITTPPVANLCDSGWEMYENKCYFFSAPDDSFFGCRSYCDSNYGATMPCVENSNQNAYLGTTKGSHMWMGYSDLIIEGSFVWEAGCSATFTDWQPGEPNNDEAGENCAAQDYQSHRWNDVTCTDSAGCVCEKPVVPYVDPQGACPDNWVEHDNNCYLFDIATISWNTCQATCSGLSAQMLYVFNAARNMYLHDEIDGDSWLGFNDKVSEGNFVWEGGFSTSYEYWHKNQPTNAQGDEDCAFLDKTRGYSWSAASCTTAQHLCSCQIPLADAATYGPLPTARPTALPTSNLAPESVLASPNYRAEIGFAFAATDSDGNVHTWGEASKGGESSGVQSQLAAGVTGIVASRYAFAALTTNGSVVPWGARTSLADQPSAETALTGLVANDGAFAGIEVGTGAVVAFGSLPLGGNAHTPSRYNQYAHLLAANISSIAASACAFCALTNRGDVYSWGSQHCGAGTSTITTPILSNVVKVVATREAFAVLLASGRVLTWGCAYGGGGSTAVSTQLMSGVIHMIASKSVFVAFKASTGIVVWGNAHWGGDTSSVSVQLSSGVTAVAQTFTALAALKADGSVVAWGKADGGGNTAAVHSQLVDVVHISGNSKAFAAVTAIGGVVAWGKAAYGGQIPSNKMTALSSGVIPIYHTDRAFAALKNDGSVVVWGQAGHGGSPGAAVEAHLVSGVHTICSNDVAFSVIKTDGSVVCWGHPVSIPSAGVVFGPGHLQGNATCSNKL